MGQIDGQPYVLREVGEVVGHPQIVIGNPLRDAGIVDQFTELIDTGGHAELMEFPGHPDRVGRRSPRDIPRCRSPSQVLTSRHGPNNLLHNNIRGQPKQDRAINRHDHILPVP
ncbi:hypothetical protein ACQP0C_25755 [Nocardia sp. CA-129566]|uniref:hypothetical protein n=1 Tax=Nocardia sp. CA-129566 TaxID=3239976 RepID=UPI003D982AE9